MTITDKLLTPGNAHGRPGNKITPVGVVVHYVANSGSSAVNNRNYFEMGGSEASAHYIVGLQGEVIRCIPENEQANHAGKAYGTFKDGGAKEAQVKLNNTRYIGIETCHPDNMGKFAESTYASLVNLVADIFKRHLWTKDEVDNRLLRHYDVCGKDCPLYYVKNQPMWDIFKINVKKTLILIPHLDKPVIGTQIMGAPTTTAAQMAAWAKKKNAAQFFVDLAPIFYDVAKGIGVDPAVAYCLSAKETGFGKFGGVLDATFCNPCGMKNSEGGGDYDKNAHKRFSSWKEGISAECEHLALYSGASGYPKPNSVDPRHFPSIKGTAKSVEDLGGKWCANPDYGKDIVKMMSELKGTVAGSSKTNSSEAGLYSVKVTAEELNVRKGPGVKYAPPIRTIKKGEVYVIAQEKNGWGRLKGEDGWVNVSSAYVKKL